MDLMVSSARCMSTSDALKLTSGSNGSNLRQRFSISVYVCSSALTASSARSALAGPQDRLGYGCLRSKKWPPLIFCSIFEVDVYGRVAPAISRADLIAYATLYAISDMTQTLICEMRPSRMVRRMRPNGPVKLLPHPDPPHRVLRCIKTKV